jgi:hypothetical protein
MVLDRTAVAAWQFVDSFVEELMVLTALGHPANLWHHAASIHPGQLAFAEFCSSIILLMQLDSIQTIQHTILHVGDNVVRRKVK